MNAVRARRQQHALLNFVISLMALVSFAFFFTASLKYVFLLPAEGVLRLDCGHNCTEETERDIRDVRQMIRKTEFQLGASGVITILGFGYIVAKRRGSNEE